jgi:hypothetical protein
LCRDDLAYMIVPTSRWRLTMVFATHYLVGASHRFRSKMTRNTDDLPSAAGNLF